MPSPEEHTYLVLSFINFFSSHFTLPAVLTGLNSKPVPFWIMVE